MNLVSLFFNAPPEIILGLYYLLCIPCNFFITFLLPNRLTRTKFLNFTFFYLLAISIFIFGLLFCLLLSLSLYYIQPPRRRKNVIQLADYPEYQHAPNGFHEIFGEGFGYKTIKNTQMPKIVREKMLVAINQFGTANVNEINTAILSDEVDELRLYAQSLIEKQERQLSYIIKNNNNLLEKAVDAKNIAFYQKQIAHAWWEEVYKNLISHENIPIILKKIEEYAQPAFEVLTEDIDLPILLAKVALKRNLDEEAKNWLLIAKKNQAPEYKTDPYLAEIAYKKKDFNEVKQLLANKKIQGIIGIQSLIAFWINND